MIDLKAKCEVDDRVREKIKSGSLNSTPTSRCSDKLERPSAARTASCTTTSVSRTLFPSEPQDLCDISKSAVSEPFHQDASIVLRSEDPPREPENLEEDTVFLEMDKYGGETKKHYCPYCRSLYTKLARHLFQVHIGEKEIKEISNLPPNHKQRKSAIACIRAKGAKIYNSLHPQSPIITRRKSIYEKKSYVTCYMCGNIYKSRFLHRHVKICPRKTSEKNTFGALKQARSEESRVMEEENCSIQLHKDVLHGIKSHEVKECIKKDSLLTTIGYYLCESYSMDRHLINLIRRKLRYLVEILLDIKNRDNDILSFKDIFQPKKIQVLFRTIKAVAKYEKGTFLNPSKAMDLNPLLTLSAKRLLNQASEEEDENTIKNVTRWMDVFRSDYNVLVSKKARRHRDTKKWNKPRRLPLTQDIIKLNKMIKNTIDDCHAKLSTKFNLISWKKLNKASMVQILIFNRKRVGDVEKMKVKDFKLVHNVDQRSDTYQMLSESEKVVCSQYMRVEVQGKHAKAMPLLLSQRMIENINTILACREAASIPEDNEFVFALNNDPGYFSAARALREYAFGCGAAQPELITGTKMRKHIATITQAFNFSDNDLSILAGYLGHNIDTHRNFYRLPDEVLQLTRISKVLSILDQGKVNQLKGKSLNEIEDVLDTVSLDPEAETEERCEAVAEVIDPETKTKRGEPSPVKLQGRHSSGTPQKTIERKYWTSPEKKIMKTFFKQHLENHTLPMPIECHEAKMRFSPLKDRSVSQIKSWIYNENNRRKKKLAQLDSEPKEIGS